MKRGRLLKLGDKIGITAPAGPVTTEKLDMAITAVEELGFQVEVGKTCYESYGGYLAGPAKMRAREINAMFANQDISAIFCLRGGYGTLQLLPLLDYELIEKHPKWFVGYSDITALHIAFQQKSKLKTIHGPMPASDLITADFYTKNSLLQLLLGNKHNEILINPNLEDLKCLVPGSAEGMLTGGNLSVVTSTLGTPYEIDTKGKILFLEEISEEPYKVDRMLTQLSLAGKFSEASGIILGTWTNCQSDKYRNVFHVEQLFENIIAPFGKPIILNVRAGHCMPMTSLPFGSQLKIMSTEKNNKICRKMIQ